MKLLLIEDEAKLRAYVKEGLQAAGFIVDEASNGVDGLHLATEGDYELVLLDVMLPGKDGFAVLEGLRLHRQTPVLMLTARNAVDDRVRGLQAGADDYLAKPFAFSELLARVQALLRRSRVVDTPSVLQVADLELDLLKRKATRGDKRLNLTAKEFTLLSLLMRRHGEVLSRTVIAEQVWDMHFDSDTNVVEVAIRRLRLKVDDGSSVPLIHTVRGMGYVLERREAD